ncbi:21439_t:CDS:2, partial [Gigaspora margarita]
FEQANKICYLGPCCKDTVKKIPEIDHVDEVIKSGLVNNIEIEEETLRDCQNLANIYKSNQEKLVKNDEENNEKKFYRAKRPLEEVRKENQQIKPAKEMSCIHSCCQNKGKDRANKNKAVMHYQGSARLGNTNEALS